MTGEVRIWDDRAGTGSPQVVLPVSETAPGTYATAAYRLDGTALHAAGKVEVVLTKGGRTDTAQLLDGGPVGGRAQVSIAASTADLPGLTLHLRGAGTDETRSVTAGAAVAVDLAPDTYDVTLETADHDVVARRDDLVVGRGSVVPLALTPQRHAELDVTLAGPAGADPTAGTLTVADTTGTVLATAHLTAFTPAVDLQGLPTGTALVLTERHDDQTARVTQATAALTTASGPAAVTLQQRLMPAADAAVTVTTAGAATAGGTVVVTQHLDGRTFTQSARTGTDGKALVHALAGAAGVHAESPFSVPSTVSAVLAAGAPTPVSLDLLRAPTYRIRPHVMTRSVGAAEVEQPVDPATALHFAETLTAGSTALAVGPAVAYDGKAGDTVTLCADGREDGLSKGCASIVLGSDPDVDVTLHLAQAGSVTAHLAGPAGTAETSWSADVVHAGDGGQVWSGHFRGGGADAVIGVPATGDYEVHWRDADGAVAVSKVTVPSSTAVALGTVTLSTSAAPPAGLTVQALPAPVLPGGLLTYRLDLPASPAARTALRLTLPAGASAAAGTATVDGRTASSTVAAGVVTVPLADAAAHVVRVLLTVGDATPGGPLAAPVTVALANGSVQDLGVAEAQVERLTLDAPTTAGSSSFPVSGLAVPGAAVSVLDGAGRVVGSGTAGAGGHWSARVQLVKPLGGQRYPLHAVAGTSSSAVAEVAYDDDAVDPISVTVDNSTSDNQRSFTFDPSKGVPSSTMVYVPSAPVTITATFADTSRVSDFRAYVGELEAKGSCSGTTCTAVVTPSGPEDMGDISIGYDTAALPVPVGDTTPAPVDSLVGSIPSPANAVSDVDVQVADDGSSWKGTEKVSGVPVEVTGTFGTPTTLPAQTADEQQVQSASGLQLRNFSSTVEETKDAFVITTSYALPSEYLEGTRPGLRAAADAPGKFDKVTDILKVYKGYKNAKTLYDLLTNGGNTPQLDGLDDWIDLNVTACNPEIGAELHHDVDDARSVLFVNKAATNAGDWISLLASSWQTAVGLDRTKLGKATSFLIDQSIGYGIKKLDQIAVDRAVEDVKRVKEGGLKECDPRIKFRPKGFRYPAPKKVATPTWIFDPSGTAYESVAAAPLSGVTATLLTGPSATGPWTTWDGAAYGQTNPQTTTATGSYGWDVPRGWWKIRWTKPGYDTAESAAMQVLPEHFGVDVDLHRTGAPTLVSTSAGVGSNGAVTVDLGFDRWMRTASVSAAVSVKDAAGKPVPGTVVAVDGTTSPSGLALGRAYRFTSSVPVKAGTVLTVTVGTTAVDSAGAPLAGAATAKATVPGSGTTPAQQLLTGFDALVVAQKVSPAVAAPLRVTLEQAAVQAAAGQRAPARATLAVYRTEVALAKALRQVDEVQRKALSGYSDTAQKVLGL
ncbi:hypothetical protein EV189_3428 [Motilibacter rhizosphaerae]|uniref:Uncharacterized protein n=1 Tax=Motilibacter rhizosphaerae TaxID=598652 RepID=A0A4Q7NAK7_9ACTN|nr:hypothetical protein EV189_3428 [Motilibacter rhizosphaerae]